MKGKNRLSSVQEFSVVWGKRKYLLCMDPWGKDALSVVHRQLAERNMPVEVKEYRPPAADLELWLASQLMGTYLYIAGSWEMVERVRGLAERAGYSEEEMQYRGFGPRVIRVCCFRCHGITPVLHEREIICRYCRIPLSVSDHYSRRRNAYLGYLRRT